MKNPKNKIRIGITMGDPSGIGPAIIAKALREIRDLAEVIIIGDKWVFEKTQKSHNQNYRFIDLNNVSRKGFDFGKVKAGYGRASIEYLDKALELIKDKEIDCLVTAPLSKEAVNLAGIEFSGHTEYLQECTQTKDTVMMLLNRQLKFSLVTRHLALKDVPHSLTKQKLSKTILITHRYLKEFFSIREPRLVVCGLNPHASDNGLIGKEENLIIKPLLSRLRRRIRYLDGPLPSDIAISRASQKQYDCIIAMYHDQALIALKLIDALRGAAGVNLTLGLPFVRTSPLHGTAFDIAGTNLASCDSLIAAIRLALRCTLNQRKV